jgi:capsular exopolysaccharide synthesis family protein
MGPEGHPHPLPRPDSLTGFKEAAVELNEYAHIIRRFWWLLLAGLLVGTAFGIYEARRAPQEFRGTVTFFVRTSGEGTTSAANLGDQFAQRRVNTYLALLRTDSTRIALEDAGVTLERDDSTARLDGTADLDTVLLTATATAPNRQHALDVATVLSEAFPKLVNEVENADPGSATVQLVLVSGPSVRPVPTTAKKTVAVYAVSGLAVASVAAFLLSLTDRKIRSLDQLRAVSGAALLGAIPRDPAVKIEPVITRETSQSVRAEAFRELRTNLKFLDLDSHTQTVIVTSAVSGEGKTATSANLATVLAHSGASVLLIEGDLRRPSFLGIFDMEPGVGLVDVLRNNVRFDTALRPLDTGLTILPSGGVAADASELLDSPEMDRLLDVARKRFEFIIIDAPPLLAVTDAAVLSVKSDGVLMVVRIDSTTTGEVQRSLAALDLVDAHVLGVVASMTSQRGLTYYGSERSTSTATVNEWPVPDGSELKNAAQDSTALPRRRDEPHGKTVA